MLAQRIASNGGVLRLWRSLRQQAAEETKNPAADTETADFPKYLPELYHEAVETFKGDIPR